MEKLTIKHLVPYLPYKLQCLAMGEGKQQFELQGISDCDYADLHEIGRTVCEQYDFEDVFPILRPISDTIKEITHNGKKVIIEWDGLDEYDERALLETIDCSTQIDLDGSESYVLECMNYSDFQILVEYHFDVFGLIQKGLAIDKNTLTNE